MKQTLVMAFVTYVSVETSGVTATPLSKVLDLLDGMNAACKPLKALHPPTPDHPSNISPPVPPAPQAFRPPGAQRRVTYVGWGQGDFPHI